MKKYRRSLLSLQLNSRQFAFWVMGSKVIKTFKYKYAFISKSQTFHLRIASYHFKILDLALNSKRQISYSNLQSMKLDFESLFLSIKNCSCTYLKDQTAVHFKQSTTNITRHRRKSSITALLCLKISKLSKTHFALVDSNVCDILKDLKTCFTISLPITQTKCRLRLEEAKDSRYFMETFQDFTAASQVTTNR